MKSNYQLLVLSIGGNDGGILQDSSDGAKSDLAIRSIQVTEDVVFTKLQGQDKDGNVVNMLSVNNLTGKTVLKPSVIGAPDINNSGLITDITISSGQILKHKDSCTLTPSVEEIATFEDDSTSTNEDGDTMIFD